MAAGRVAGHQQAAVEAPPQMKAGIAKLTDDVGDRNLRAEIVADHRDRDAMRVHSACHVAVERGLAAAPVAAVDEHHHGRVCRLLRREQVDDLALARPIADADFGAAFLARLRTVRRRVGVAPREDRRMIGH